jgi:hypothetical protein
MPTTIDSAGITFNDTTSLTSANIGTAQLVNGSVTASKLGTTEQKQICKAWVNFNCITGAVNSSYNVSSVTLVTSGANWIINFSTPMTDANYVVTLAQNSNVGGAVDGRNCVLAINNGSQTINSVQIYSYNSVSGLNGGATGNIGISIFGN